MTIQKIKSRLRPVVLSAAVCLFAGLPAFAATETPTGSLFFTPDETKQIEALARKNPQNATGHSDVHLGAVMYYGPGNWTLWLQGERWTPSTERADLHVLDVAPGEVHLSVSATPDTPPRDIVLRPHQTYRIATGDVVEGGP